MTTRRTLLGAISAATVSFGAAAPLWAQDVPEFTFSAVFSQQDIRAGMMEQFKEAVADIADLQLYYGGNLFTQGTEISPIPANMGRARS